MIQDGWQNVDTAVSTIATSSTTCTIHHPYDTFPIMEGNRTQSEMKSNCVNSWDWNPAENCEGEEGCEVCRVGLHITLIYWLLLNYSTLTVSTRAGVIINFLMN